MTPLALAGGTWIFVAFAVVLFIALVYGYYTRVGSGISQTPYRRPDGPPESPSELAHDTIQTPQDWQRGTEGHHRPHHAHTQRPSDPDVSQALAEWRSGSGSSSSSARRLDPPLTGTEPARGPDGAPSVVLWIDASNGPCRSAYRLLSELADEGRIRLVVRQLPLADVHPLSLPAAHALESAAAQGAFFALLDDVAGSPVRDEHELLERAARHVSDPDRLREEVRAGAHRTFVVAQIRQAAASGARAVPAVYIDGAHYDGPIRRDELTRALRT